MSNWQEQQKQVATGVTDGSAKQEQGKSEIKTDLCVMVGYSKANNGYFVYEETAPQEFCAIKGPFATRIEAENAMRNSNAELINTQPAQPKQEQGEPVAAKIAAQLRAMACNYPTGHLWDKLDAKACIEGALLLEGRHPKAPPPQPKEPEQLGVDLAPTDFHVFSKAGTSNVTPKGKKK